MNHIKLDCLIQNEFNYSQQKHFFTFNRAKFLHNIDTFYYSVTLNNDFAKDTSDDDVLYMRRWFNNNRPGQEFDGCNVLNIPGTDEVLLFRDFSFSKYYKNCIEVAEEFDIFIADMVPTSLTPQILVQIRSCSLWLNGVNKAYEKSIAVVKAICKYFNFSIQEVKENRIDYCWHTNYIQRPDLFFEPHRFAEMEVSRFKRVTFQYQLKKIDSQIENDYISMGSRGDKCFVRFYLKSKEVIEQGYKGWFLRLWYFNGLINMYDLYVYERLFLCRNWKKLDYYRLQFYIEFGDDENVKKVCRDLCDSDTVDYAAMKKLADQLTPTVTLVMNIEFQTSRKSTKSYCILENPRNEKYGVEKRIYDYLDNRKMITDYLTNDTLRLVKTGNDSNKARAEYTDFWNRLRNTKQIDVKMSKREEKLTRDYSRKLNKEMVKTRMTNSIVNYSLYSKGINEDDVMDDIVAAVVRLNDNDIEKMRHYKDKRRRLLNKQDFSETMEDASMRYSLIDNDTGEIL